VEKGIITTGTEKTRSTHSSKLSVKKKDENGETLVPNDTLLGDQSVQSDEPSGDYTNQNQSDDESDD
jgi:hypothetical protein